jgi:16S rRNA (guanine1207-N2)-methyltransferase
MHPTLQILERHESELSNAKINWFDVPHETHLVKADDAQYNLNWSTSNSTTLSLDAWPTNDLNILFIPKAKDRLDWWLYQLASNLTGSQKLWIVGENNGGIKSIPKRIKNYFDCHKVDSARHCALIELTRLELPPEPKIATPFSVDDLNFNSLPGVFSAGRLDKGTDILLEVLPKLKGQILEFGAGCGVLSSILASQPSITSVDAVEIDLLAVRSALSNVEANGLEEKINVFWSDGTSELPAKKYDAIVTNPPFHKGINTEYGPTDEFFREAHEWLKPHGQLIWVANDFLNYQSLLTQKFKSIKTIAQVRGFKVYSAVMK